MKFGRCEGTYLFIFTFKLLSFHSPTREYKRGLALGSGRQLKCQKYDVVCTLMPSSFLPPKHTEVTPNNFIVSHMSLRRGIPYLTSGGSGKSRSNFEKS